MAGSTVNNKRIVKNTLFLYGRMIIIMLIGLYTVRAVLQALGVEDYGIYNVVGGIVSMMSFITGTLTTSSQRFFAIEMTKNNGEGLKRCFSLNLTVFIVLMLLAVVVAETVGLWFLNTKLTIPESRMFASNVVYQLSVITFCLQLIAIPYNALIVSYEKMNIYAYISIAESLVKLAAVLALTIVGGDKLIIYALFMLAVSTGATFFNIIYCCTRYKESRYNFLWDAKEIKVLFGFSGWHFLGTIASVIRTSGINILINMFFNPAVNGARAIAYQVNSAVNQLSNNFFTAVKPQIYKSYGAGEIEAMHTLILRSTTLCLYLVSIMCMPVLFTTEGVLKLWLHDVPEMTVIFTQLVLVTSMIEATTGPGFASALATGRIRNFYLVVGTLYIMVLPVSYVALKLGCPAWITMFVDILFSFLNVYVRVIFLRNLIGLSLRRYVNLTIRVILTTVITSIILYVIAGCFELFWVNLIVITAVSTVLLSIGYFLFVISSEDRKAITMLIKNKIKR